MEVPEHVSVSGIGDRVAFVRAVEQGQLDRVADEEDRF